jgi:hypothetical protein
MLAARYVLATLSTMKENAGFVYRTHATAGALVADHCAHWQDLLDPKHRRVLDIETERLRRTCPDAHAMLRAYLEACLAGVSAHLDAVDLEVLVVCVWHHVHAQAARGALLDAATCEVAVNGALKSVRDIVCANAAKHAGSDPCGIARFA